jgi:hypothetical protein
VSEPADFKVGQPAYLTPEIRDQFGNVITPAKVTALEIESDGRGSIGIIAAPPRQIDGTLDFSVDFVTQGLARGNCAKPNELLAAERERLAKLLEAEAQSNLDLAKAGRDFPQCYFALEHAAALIRAENDRPYSKPDLGAVLHAHEAGAGNILAAENEPAAIASDEVIGYRAGIPIRRGCPHAPENER